LVIATGHVGSFWAQGASLGERSGAVMVNGLQVGLLFQPLWTVSTILVSEVSTKLPLSTMHAYARSVLDALEPSSLALLDSYPTPSYITSDTRYNAPVRYLCASELRLNTAAQPYSPPNLVQSTAASFLAVFRVCRSVSGAPCVAILLPSSRLSDPLPKELKAGNSLVDADPEEWPPHTMNVAQDCLFGSRGVQWENKSGRGRGTYPSARRKNEIGEGGMYI